MEKKKRRLPMRRIALILAAALAAGAGALLLCYVLFSRFLDYENLVLWMSMSGVVVFSLVLAAGALRTLGRNT